MPASQDMAVRHVLIHRVEHGACSLTSDDVAVEAPLELRLSFPEKGHSEETTICVTMRTPGQDLELAVGFLFAERVIGSVNDLALADAGRPEIEDDTITIPLRAAPKGGIRRLQRNVFTSSSCGVCGTPSLDALAHAACPDLPSPSPTVSRSVIARLPAILFDRQSVFQDTGGLHAAALFDADGSLLRVREDVGRHNAMDKLIGSCLLDDVRLDGRIVLVSGRTSYELVQKALVAGIPILAAVGAASSLAVGLAQAHDLTLIGFIRGERYNVYHGEERLRLGDATKAASRRDATT